MVRIHIIPVGGIGNQMLQLIYAHAIADRLGSACITGYNIPIWGLRAAQDQTAILKTLIVGGHMDINLTAALVKKFGLQTFRLRDVRFRVEDFPPRERVSALFNGRGAKIPGFGDDYLVIHIRGWDTLYGAHIDYGPLPLSYYRQLIERTGLKPVFMGQLGEDFYSNRLRGHFRNALFIPSREPLIDFETIRNSKNIAISVSTFAWLAAWFSDAATIHLPLSGMFNPAQRPDINLLPVADRRYSYYRFPIRHWRMSDADLEALSAELPLQELEVDKVEICLRRAWRRMTLRRFRKNISLYGKVALASLRQRSGS